MSLLAYFAPTYFGYILHKHKYARAHTNTLLSLSTAFFFNLNIAFQLLFLFSLRAHNWPLVQSVIVLSLTMIVAAFPAIACVPLSLTPLPISTDECNACVPLPVSNVFWGGTGCSLGKNSSAFLPSSLMQLEVNQNFSFTSQDCLCFTSTTILLVPNFHYSSSESCSWIFFMWKVWVFFPLQNPVLVYTSMVLSFQSGSQPYLFGSLVFCVRCVHIKGSQFEHRGSDYV